MMPKIVTNGLQCYLDAANSKSYPGNGTNWYDLSGNNNHGALSGSTLPTWSSGGYFNFNAGGNGIIAGNYNRIDFANQTPFHFAYNSSFTIITVFKTSNANTNIGFLYSIKNGVSNTGGIWGAVSAGNGAYSDINTNISSQRKLYEYTDSTFNDNTWKFHIVTYSTNNLNYSLNLSTYNNVTLNQTISNGNFYDANSYFMIGAGWKNDTLNYRYDYMGDISIFMMYNRALSNSEILQNYNALKSRFNL